MGKIVNLDTEIFDGEITWIVNAVMCLEGERHYLLVDRDDPHMVARMDGAYVERLHLRNLRDEARRRWAEENSLI